MTMKNYSSRRVRRRISKAEDRFGALSDELILHIMETTRDAKTLTRCLAVSKRFASLVRTTRSVTLSIHRPMLGVQCYNLTPDPLHYLPIVPRVSLRVIVGNKTTKLRPYGLHWPRLPLNRNQHPEILAQLKCFDEIRNLSIRFTRGDVPFRCNDVINWKLEMSLDYSLGFKSCVVLERVRVDESGSGVMKNRFRSEWVRKRVKWLAALIRLLLEMNPVLGQILRDHPTVQEVTVGDYKGEIRGGGVFYGPTPEKTDLSMRTCFVPLIELSEPVRCAVEGQNQTASGVMVTVVRPFDLEKCDWFVDVGLVRSGLGDGGGFGPEIAEKIASSQSDNIMELRVVVNMGHTSEHD